MTDFTKRTLLLGLAAALVTTPALAQSGKNQFSGLITPPSFNAADKARIASATAYLQALGTAHGRFEQTDYKGRKSAGNWYLARPGKMRFEYDAPTSLLIVSNGKTVSMWDPRLQTFDQYPLSETPLSLFLARHIRLDKGVRITRVVRQPGQFTVTARDGSGKAGGYIQLTFADNPVSLREWVVMDAQGATTRVRVQGLQPAGGLDPKLFILNDPRPQPGA